MNQSIFLSIAAISLLHATDITLNPVNVDSTVINEVSQNAKTSADISEVLSNDIPSVDMSRRSGIANDVIIRGLKRDNISVSVDGTKTYGACPNRMDPPVSHILTNNIRSVEVIEGPYDVSQYGVLGGGVKITTKQPTKKFHSDLNFAVGSWNYKKLSATASGGNDKIRILVSGSSEDSDQYEDGIYKALEGKTTIEEIYRVARL